ncbi:MAG: hypothetical protein HS108_13535 [Planctomycetes bacterium]|jgi:hypothetical protein|nr:hypothetical protein [Planctomycetota bacterium]MCL4730769.1 hypothetical protein [Planctomycetota bacterium]
MKTLMIGLLAALVCAPLAAQEEKPAEPGLKVGDEAADLEIGNWINTPAVPRFSDLRGDVILLKSWGIN